MKYSDELIKEVDRLYHNKKYNAYAKNGEEILGRFLDDESHQAISNEFILQTIKENEPKKAVKILKEEAETLQAKRDLYGMWIKESDAYYKEEQENM